jgi:hypothetical protein
VDALRHTLFANGSLPMSLSAAVLLVFALLCNWYGLRSFRAILEPR